MSGTWPNLDLSDLTDRTRINLNEATARIFTDDNIYRWLSMSVNDIGQKTTCVRNIIDKVTTVSTRTVSTSGILKVMFVEFVPSSGRSIMLTKIDTLKIGHNTINGVTPQYWYESGDSITIEPIPNDVYTLRLYVISVPKIFKYQLSFSSNWTAGTGWATAYSATHTGATSGLITYNLSIISASTEYTIKFTVNNIGTGGNVTPRLGATIGTQVNSNGVHTQNITSPSGTPQLIFEASNTVSINTVMVYKRVDFSTTTDQTELSTKWQNLLVLYATANGLLKDKRITPSNIINNIYNNELNYIKSNIIEIIPDGKDNLKY